MFIVEESYIVWKLVRSVYLCVWTDLLDNIADCQFNLKKAPKWLFSRNLWTVVYAQDSRLEIRLRMASYRLSFGYFIQGCIKDWTSSLLVSSCTSRLMTVSLKAVRILISACLQVWSSLPTLRSGDNWATILLPLLQHHISPKQAWVWVCLPVASCLTSMRQTSCTK